MFERLDAAGQCAELVLLLEGQFLGADAGRFFASTRPGFFSTFAVGRSARRRWRR